MANKKKAVAIKGGKAQKRNSNKAIRSVANDAIQGIRNVMKEAILAQKRANTLAAAVRKVFPDNKINVGAIGWQKGKTVVKAKKVKTEETQVKTRGRKAKVAASASESSDGAGSF